MPDTLSPSTAGRVTAFDSEDVTTSESEGSTRHVRRSKRIATTKKGHKPSIGSPNGSTNGLLAVPGSPGKQEARSPTPLGLIPIHSTFQSFIHRHEIPRKALHVSIGFITLSLYANGFQSNQIHPALLTALVPIATADVLRHNSPVLNRWYIKLCGALMRESEVDGYNGVIWYLAGTWAVLRFFPKDIGTVGVLLLSWCDTAASTFGRAYGQYTWRVRKGKSVAGSAAALATGVITAWVFWGWAVPTFGTANGYDIPPNTLAFQGALEFPNVVKGLLGWEESDGIIRGPLALGVLSLWTGLIASASEAVDIFNWDDNFTIPVLCGAGIYGFLKVFGTTP